MSIKTLNEKRIIRIAQLTGYVIPKHCRKKQFRCVQGKGLTDEEAIENFKEEYKVVTKNCKDIKFGKDLIVFDAWIQDYGNYETISQPLMPTARDNLKTYEIQL